jgi:hypothetical protein
LATYTYGTRKVNTTSVDRTLCSEQDNWTVQELCIMPSIFSKIGGSSKRNNPYRNPHHPSHKPLPQKHTTDPIPIMTQQTDLPPVSRNLLAEARQLANRDPVTGRLLPSPVMPQSANEANKQPKAQSKNTPNATEVSAYSSRASQTVQTTGSKYELFSIEERRRIAREERIRIARGGGEFYAPERKLDEYYGARVSDW